VLPVLYARSHTMRAPWASARGDLNAKMKTCLAPEPTRRLQAAAAKMQELQVDRRWTAARLSLRLA
jgi:hypothetical protein